MIDEEKCIRCGQCIHRCPFGAIGSKTDIVAIIKDMLAGKKVVAMFAPAIEGQFGREITCQVFVLPAKRLDLLIWWKSDSVVI